MASASDRAAGVAGAAWVSGFAFEAGRSRRIAAVLARDAASGVLTLTDCDTAETLTRCRPETVKREARLGNLESEAALPQGWRFFTDDHDGLDRLLGRAPGGGRHRWERFGPHLAVVVLAVAALAFAVWRWGLDIMVAAAVMLTPPSFVETMDRANLEAFDRTIAAPTALSEGEQARLQTIFDRLASAASPAGASSDLNLRFRAMDGLGPNALALPGGTVIVTDELVQRFPDEDILAGVLGHEIAHVQEEHGLKRIYRSLSIYVLVMLIVGDVGPFLEDALLEGNLLLSLAHSREQEREADRIGIELAEKAGYEPAALAEFLEALSNEIGGRQPNGWLSTHPAPTGRAEAVRELAGDR